jgi:hypothetical protein
VGGRGKGGEGISHHVQPEMEFFYRDQKKIILNFLYKYNKKTLIFITNNAGI